MILEFGSGFCKVSLKFVTVTRFQRIWIKINIINSRRTKIQDKTRFLFNKILFFLFFNLLILIPTSKNIINIVAKIAVLEKEEKRKISNKEAIIKLRYFIFFWLKKKKTENKGINKARREAYWFGFTRKPENLALPILILVFNL